MSNFNLKSEIKELKQDVRKNIKIDKAAIAMNAIAFLTLVSGGIAGTVKSIAEDPKDINGYFILPICLVAYFLLTTGSSIASGITPKMPEEHINKYKQELRKLYKKQQIMQLSQKTK